MGDNPWYEVVLTEGRNRELSKMFAAIGHFAEKIRRVGYGPLVLDVEPGKLRELTADEVNALRLTAEGKNEAAACTRGSGTAEGSGNSGREASQVYGPQRCEFAHCAPSGGAWARTRSARKNRGHGPTSPEAHERISHRRRNGGRGSGSFRSVALEGRLAARESHLAAENAVSRRGHGFRKGTDHSIEAAEAA